MESKVDLRLNVDQRSDYTDIASNQVNPILAESRRYTQYSTRGATAGHLATLIDDKLSMLDSNSYNSYKVCIYRVPQKHRNKNQEAYTPRLVSIGLLHHGKNHLRGMEDRKLKYLHHFLQIFQVPTLKLAEFVHRQEKSVCGCYENDYIRNLSKLSEVNLSEVLLLDGIFIVELFLKNYFPEMRERGDLIFDNPWISSDIMHDLMLLENQLPMMFVSELYDIFVLGNVCKCLDDVKYPQSFNELAHKYFWTLGNTRKPMLPHDFGYTRHLVEFLSVLHKPDRDLQRPYIHFWQKAGCATATMLLLAGVKFQRGTSKSLFDVEFNPNNGELKIPLLTLNYSTEAFFRNQMAFEHSEHCSKYMTSYVILLSSLINTYRDVDILVEHRIIRNQLGSSAQVAELFNNLHKAFAIDQTEFCFIDICSDLDDYSRNFWHKCKSKLVEWCKQPKFVKWFTELFRDYFGSPWSIISIFAAFILLSLTVIQTVCSLLQVNSKH